MVIPALLLPALAQSPDPFANIEGSGGAAPPPPPSSAPPPATAPTVPAADLGAPAICDDIAAAGAAQSFHVFVGGSALLAALVGAALWFALERAAKGSWLLRTLAGAGLAAGAGMALVATHPIATEAQRSLMESPACMHHFWLGAQGPLGQGLMLGLLPAGLLALLAIAAARRLV